MIRDITIGQYYPVNSILHRLDPRVKIIATMLFVVELFVFDSLFGYIAMAVGLGIVIAISKVPLGHILKGLRPVLFLLIFTILLNTIHATGDNVILEWGFVRVTVEGFINAAYVAVRLIMLIIGSSLLTFTTTPSALTDGIEKLSAPLKIFRVPVHELAMMMSIALRFIPILVEETDKIVKAQQARGASFDTGNIIQKAKSLVPLLVPLFVSAFRRATDLAMAMEARCYRGGKGRTKMKPLRFKALDYGTMLVMGLCLTALIVLL